jgi:hypothetical protein
LLGGNLRAMLASPHRPQLTRDLRRYSPTLLLRADSDWWAASLAWAASNCSRVTTAGTTAGTTPTSIHSASGTGAAVPWAHPIGWVAERRTLASRYRVRPAKTRPV